MEARYINWFLTNIEDKRFTKISQRYMKYEYYNFSRDDVPFDTEFKSFLESYIGDTDFDFECYHIHKWNVGSHFDEHIDDRENRKFSYVCELQESECKTKLLVNTTESNEAWFDVKTKHTVPKIQKGQRISLTIFGKNNLVKSLM